MKILIQHDNKKVKSIALTSDKKTIATLKRKGYVIAGQSSDMAEAQTYLLINGYYGDILKYHYTTVK